MWRGARLFNDLKPVVIKSLDISFCSDLFGKVKLLNNDSLTDVLCNE